MKEKLKSILIKYPSLYRFFQNYYWKFNEFKALIFGTRLEEKRWAQRSFKEVEKSLADLNHPHRKFLVEKINAFQPESILEIGCGYGPNLFWLAKKIPNAKIKGIDINSLAIRLGRELFKKEELKNVELLEKKADELSEFRDKEFDVVLTDALLICIGPDKIKKVIRELARISRKGIIMAEWHTPEGIKEIYDPHIGVWRRNYKILLSEIFPRKSILISKIPTELWPDENWQKFGYIIEVII